MGRKSSQPPFSPKIVVVGDGGCGKTSLLIRLIKDEFHNQYIPTVFDTQCTDMDIDGNTISLKLWDTAGQEEFDALRRLSYPDTDVVMVCFSIDTPQFVENVDEKWVPEVHHYCSDRVPILLVGCKTDQRTSLATIEQLKEFGHHPITLEEGRALSARIGANAYVECSALTCEGVRNVFETAGRLALKARSDNRQFNPFRCCMKAVD